VSRPSCQLRDAALGYASRGVPVLPLHYPLPHHGDLQALTGEQQRPRPAGGSGCSCRDPDCGQPAKHPLGSLVPHGVKDATCNRARILAWWTRHPSANIGLATGHTFDILDVDGQKARPPSGPWPPAMACRARGRSSALAGVAGTSTWSPLALAMFTPGTSSMWTGGAGAAMWSPHLAATPPATPTTGQPAATSTPHPARSRRYC
jgi:hypothetical protein